MLKKLAYAAATYTALGLIGGLLYRTITHGEPWKFTQLNVLHTHLLALGTLVMLVALALEKLFGLSQRREMSYFFWVYNAGLLITTASMAVKGIMQQHEEVDSPAIAGISGMGHILITVGFVFFFVALLRRISATSDRSPAVTEPTS